MDYPNRYLPYVYSFERHTPIKNNISVKTAVSIEHIYIPFRSVRSLYCLVIIRSCWLLYHMDLNMINEKKDDKMSHKSVFLISRIENYSILYTYIHSIINMYHLIIWFSFYIILLILISWKMTMNFLFETFSIFSYFVHNLIYLTKIEYIPQYQWLWSSHVSPFPHFLRS